MITFSKNSLHYRLATFYGDFGKCVNRDLCTYSKEIVKGCFSVLFVIIAGSLLLYAMLLHPIFLFIGAEEWNVISALSAFIWGCIGVINYLIFENEIKKYFTPVREYIRKVFKRFEKREEKVKTDNFISTWFKSVKEKVCFTIEFK